MYSTPCNLCNSTHIADCETMGRPMIFCFAAPQLQLLLIYKNASENMDKLRCRSFGLPDLVY
jgi:hypothetical protein